MKNYRIRTTVEPGDIGSIIKLHGEYYHRHNGFDASFEPYVAIPLSEFAIRSNPRERIWIVARGAEVKGSIAIVDIGNDGAQLRWYLLDDDMQGRGIGRELIQLALAFVAERKYKRVILWTVIDQARAIEIYIKNGFRLIEEKRHRQWGADLTEQCYEFTASP